MDGFLIFIGIITILGLTILAAYLYEHKRAKAIEAIAKSLNFSFKRKDDGSLLEIYNSFSLIFIFSKGHSKKISNIVHGSSGDMNITMMDYKYLTSGRSPQRHNSHCTCSQTIIVVQSKHLMLPSFTLSPEKIYYNRRNKRSLKDIDFASHPKFSKQYLLRGSDEEAVRNIFSDELIEFYEKDKTLSTEGSNDKFIYYKANKKLAPKDIQAFLQEGIDLYGLLKTQSLGLH